MTGDPSSDEYFEAFRVRIDDSGDSGEDNLRYVRSHLDGKDYNVHVEGGDQHALIIEARVDESEIEALIPDNNPKLGGGIPYELERLDDPQEIETLAESERQSYEARIEELQDHKEYLAEQVSTLEDTVEELESKNESVIDDSQSKEKELQRLRGRHQQIKSDLNDVRAEKAALEDRNDELQEEYDELEQEYQELEERFEDLEERLHDSMNAALEDGEIDIDGYLEGRAASLTVDGDLDEDVTEVWDKSETEYVSEKTGFTEDEVEEMLEVDGPVEWTDEDQKQYEEASRVLGELESTDLLDEDDIEVPKETLEERRDKLEQKKEQAVDIEKHDKVVDIAEDYSRIKGVSEEVLGQLGTVNIGLVERDEGYGVKVPDVPVLGSLIESRVSESVGASYDSVDSGNTREMVFDNIVDRRELEDSITSAMTQEPLSRVESRLTIDRSLNAPENEQIPLRDDQESFQIEKFLRNVRNNDELPDESFRRIAEETGNRGFGNPIKGVEEDYDKFYGNLEEFGPEESDKMREIAKGVEN